MVQWLGDRQPTSAVKCAELVWQLGHCSYPPLRLLLGSYAIESIRDRLRSVTEELEDWKHLNYPVAPDAPGGERGEKTDKDERGESKEEKGGEGGEMEVEGREEKEEREEGEENEKEDDDAMERVTTPDAMEIEVR